MIRMKTCHISNVVISTALGISGQGIFLRKWNPNYRRLIQVALETKTSVISKSFTFWEYLGNLREWLPWTGKYIRTLPDTGMLNAYRLTNPGMETSLRMISESADRGFSIIPSFYPRYPMDDDAFAPSFMYRKRNINVVEINASCTNTLEEIKANILNTLALVSRIKTEFPKLIIIVKIGYVHPCEFAQELEHVGADAIHAVNTIPFGIVYPERTSPLAKVGGGGVSGGPAREKAMRYIKELRKCIKGPMIAGCGIRNLEDAKAYCDLIRTDDSISICTVALRNPKEAIRIIERYNR